MECSDVAVSAVSSLQESCRFDFWTWSCSVWSGVAMSVLPWCSDFLITTVQRHASKGLSLCLMLKPITKFKLCSWCEMATYPASMIGSSLPIQEKWLKTIWIHLKGGQMYEGCATWRPLIASTITGALLHFTYF